MKRSNDNLTLVNRNWKLQVNGKYVGLFGLYNAIGDYNFNYVVVALLEPIAGACERVAFRPMRYNGKRVNVTAFAK